MNKNEFKSQYQEIQKGITQLEKDRGTLLAQYREALGMSAKERLSLLVQFWPDVEKIVLETGLSTVSIKATASHLGLSRLSKPARGTLKHRVYLAELAGR